jgi:hypothetical protein
MYEYLVFAEKEITHEALMEIILNNFECDQLKTNKDNFFFNTQNTGIENNNIC